MTLSPHRIGDKGQRFEVRYADNEDGENGKPFGWSPTKEGAEQMAAAWRLRPSIGLVWVVDREIPHGGDGSEAVGEKKR